MCSIFLSLLFFKQQKASAISFIKDTCHLLAACIDDKTIQFMTKGKNREIQEGQVVLEYELILAAFAIYVMH